MRPKLRPLSLLLLLAPALLLSGCGNDDKQAAAAPVVKDYPVLTLAPQSTTLTSDYPATIQGRQDVEIRPLIEGYLGRILVDEGSPVRAGQVLFTINAPQYRQQVITTEAAIKIAQAEVNAARMQVDKVRPLVQENIISAYELKGAQYTLQSKLAALAQAQAALANARTNEGYTQVRSPVGGVVGSLPYKLGSLVGSGTAQPLTTVSDVGNVFAYFSINEKQVLDIAGAAAGTTTAQRLAAMPAVALVLANGDVLPQKGHVEAVSGTINTQTGSVRVRATFPNPGGVVRSGSSGRVRIPVTLDSALIIPQKATYELQGKKFVYVVQDSGRVASVPVQVLANNNGQYFVVQSGLRPGTRIVVEGVAGLREGAAIRPRPVPADSLYRELLK